MEKENLESQAKTPLQQEFHQPTAEQDNNQVYFGLASQRGETVPYLTFRNRDGSEFMLHHAYIFNMFMPSQGKLVLMIPSIRTDIIISGRGLGQLRDFLHQRKVLWIRESPTPEIDDAGEGVFIRSITREEKGRP